MSETPAELSQQEVDVLTCLVEIVDKIPKRNDRFASPLDEGWVTSASVREALGAGSLETRRALRRLADWGYVNLKKMGSVDTYSINGRGSAALLRYADVPPVVDSATWTGTVSPVQIHSVMKIVSEIEDVCETITDNYARSQILGLIRAIEILLDVPDPPKQGIVALVRDPAFNHIVGFGTFLAAIAAALKA